MTEVSQVQTPEKVEEELRKEGISEEPQKESGWVDRERVEAKSTVMKARSPASALEEELREVERVAESRVSQIQQQLRDLEELEKSDIELLTPKFFGGLDKRTLEKLLDKLGGGDNGMQAVIALYMLNQITTQQMLNQMILVDWMEERRMRRQLMLRQMGLVTEGVERSRPSKEMVAVTKMVSSMNKLLAELKEAVASARTPQQQASLKEVLEVTKEMLQLIGSRSNVDETVAKMIAPALDKLAEAVRELKEAKNSGNEFETVKRTLDMVKSITEYVKELVGGVGGSTVTTAPLKYKGEAPWTFHPDARVAIKDYIKAVGEMVKDVLVAMKGAGKVPIASGSQPPQKASLPKDLEL